MTRKGRSHLSRVSLRRSVDGDSICCLVQEVFDANKVKMPQIHYRLILTISYCMIDSVTSTNLCILNRGIGQALRLVHEFPCKDGRIVLVRHSRYSVHSRQHCLQFSSNHHPSLSHFSFIDHKISK